MKKKLFLFDIMPLLYRAHFATLGKNFGTTTGIDTRTTLVFYNYIFQVLTEEKPDAVAAVLDSKPKQREAVSSVYKANREKMPSEISDAFPYALKLMEALKIPILKEEGFEADDVIATMALQGMEKGYTVFIVSPDKDFAQLVSENIFLFRPAYKGAIMETLDIEGVKNKFGVPPQQIADYLALRGDSVDNIIGVKGIGDKTAAQLLSQYNSVETLIENVGSIKQPKLRESIEAYKDQLVENKLLATLTGDVVVAVEWNELKVKKAEGNDLIPLLDELQFIRIKERLIKQRFLNTKLKTEEIPLSEITVHSLTAKDVITQLQGVNEIAIAYTEENRQLYFKRRNEVDILTVNISSEEEWNSLLAYLMKDEVLKIGWQLKPLLKKISLSATISGTSWLDLSLAAYLLEPDAKIEWPYIQDKYNLERFNISHGQSQLNHLPALFQANDSIMKRLEEMELTPLFYEIELPLQSVIARMELYGLRIGLDALQEIDSVLTLQLNQLEKQLHETAGKEININSPGQIAEVLQKICDPSELKKTKTGQVSTAEPFLMDIAPKYPFINDLLTYRKLNKIITTYVYSLPKYVNAQTTKIHPTFQQVIAGTGRLSCTEPNLQNLPIKSEAGREVRKAIIPSTTGYTILSIDYNQVELRLLAALSNDEVMVETFRSGKDIHTTTASRIFNVDESAVTKELRNKAKSVNFGIAYGITPWGLATRLKISQKEAKEIIDAYFAEFSSVKQYLENSINESRERGFTKTKYGRIRYVEGLDSKNTTTRKIAERVAVNAPIQGLAADIIKEAMVNVDRFIIVDDLKTRIILQVHDELVFDALESELPFFVPEVIRIMESNPKFIVPLIVNVTAGKNWLEQDQYIKC